MYKKQNLQVFPANVLLKSDIDFDERKKYRPFSYYVKGGIDLDGDALMDGAPTTFDTDDDIAGVDCVAEATSDPRVSWCDIVEKAGVDSYEKYKQELARQAQQQADKSNENNE